ncbi:MAG: RNA-binding protein [Deltaproteobacteria bacterium]
MGNLNFDTTKEELEEIFSELGQVVDCFLPKDRETGRPRGFAFVEYADSSSAGEAVEKFDGYELGGRNLRVNEADERRRGPGGPGGPPGGGGGGGYGGGPGRGGGGGYAGGGDRGGGGGGYRGGGGGGGYAGGGGGYGGGGGGFGGGGDSFGGGGGGFGGGGGGFGGGSTPPSKPKGSRRNLRRNKRSL